MIASGCDRSLLGQITELERRRVRIQMLALNGRTGRVLARPFGAASVGAHPRLRGPIAAAWSSRTAAWIVREAARGGITHLHACGSIHAAAAAHEAARLGGFQFSFAANGDREWLRHRVLSAYLHDAEFVTVSCRADAVALAALDPALARRAYVLPPGIDVRPLAFQGIRPESTGRVLAFVTGPPKSIRPIAETLPSLDTGECRVRMAIAPTEDGIAAARALDPAPDGHRRILALEAAVSGENGVPAAAYDVVVWVDGRRAEHEQPPAGVLQAMAIGVPVVHVAREACDVVEDGRSGFVVPVDARERLVRAMRLTLWNEVVRRRFTRAARRRVEREFNMLVMCTRLRRLFAESALARQAWFRETAADR